MRALHPNGGSFIASTPVNDGPQGPNATHAIERQGFARWDVSSNENPSARMNTEERCGVYVLAFEDAQWYVGQSVDVVRRYVEHQANHDDIARVYFKTVERSALNDVERSTVALLEHLWGWPTRNIRLSSLPKGEPELFDLLSESDFERWLRDPSFYLEAGSRTDLDVQARKLAARQAELDNHPRVRDVKRLVEEYLKRLLPLPLSTQMDYWSLSCLPQAHAKTLVRLNLNWQEVFTLINTPNGILASFHVARSPLQRPLLKRAAFRLRNPGLRFINHTYEPGGPDQVQLLVRGANSAARLMRDSDFTRAARLFNGRLMRKGRVNAGNAASHCAGWVASLNIQERSGTTILRSRL